MSLERRFLRALPVALIVTVLVAVPTIPAYASGEDAKAAETAKKDETAKAKSETAPPANTADGKECKPQAKFNTFEDFYGARNWMLRASATPASAEATIVWRDSPLTEPAAKPASRKN